MASCRMIGACEPTRRLSGGVRSFDDDRSVDPSRDPAISTRFPRDFNTVELVGGCRQETQIVQSCKILDNFLRAPWKGARS